MPSIRVLPDALEREQQHTLGIVETDKGGDNWSHVEFPAGTYVQGQVIRDSLTADIVGNSGVGSVTAAAAVDTRELKDTGEFSAKQYLRGAIGEIYQGGGQGQKFIVVAVADADTLIISVEGKGWQTALTTASRYNLILPGRAIVATAGSPFVRGVIQREGFTVPANETRYGWVKMTGLLQAQKDNSGTAFAANQGVVPTTGGLVIGSGAAPNGLSIGIPAFTEPGGTADALVTLMGTIGNNLRSARKPVGREQGYTDNFGNPIKI